MLEDSELWNVIVDHAPLCLKDTNFRLLMEKGPSISAEIPELKKFIQDVSDAFLRAYPKAEYDCTLLLVTNLLHYEIGLDAIVMATKSIYPHALGLRWSQEAQDAFDAERKAYLERLRAEKKAKETDTP